MESGPSHLPAAAGRIDVARLDAVCDAAVVAAAAATSPTAAIEAAIETLHHGLDAVFVAAFVVEHGRLWSAGARGYGMIPDGLPFEEGVIGRAVREGVPQVVSDVRSDADFVPIAEGVTSELAIPLIFAGDVVGIVNIETGEPLPPGGERAATVLGDALAPVMEELRSAGSADLSSLARLFVYISSLRDPLRIAEVAVRSLARVLPMETSQLLVSEENGRLVEAAAWSSAALGLELLPAAALEALRDHIDPSAVLEQLDSGVVDLPELSGMAERSVFLLPLRANGAEFGLLAGSSLSRRDFDREQGEVASLLAAHVAASLDAAVVLGRERRSALTDPLTGLLNRRGLEERLERELDDAQGDRRPLSVLVLDCDDFKDVNDRAGHEFGDALLREIGLVLVAVCPAEGCAARLGGDEFVVMLPATDADSAYDVASTMREQLSAGLAEAGFPLHLSAGVATYPFDGGGATQLIRAADQALYQAKDDGKDRVIAFRDLVRGTMSAEAAAERRRGGSVVDGGMLVDATAAASAIWAEETLEDVLERLCKSVSFVVGATGTLISRVDGPRLTDIVRHSLRDIDLGDDTAYLIEDFPLTQVVLETGAPCSISFLDEDLDRAEAFVLRELRMNCALMVPLRVNGRSWGLVEIYDMRMRRFSREEEAVSAFIVDQAGRRIESLGAVTGHKRRLPLFRIPSERVPGEPAPG